MTEKQAELLTPEERDKAVDDGNRIYDWQNAYSSDKRSREECQADEVAKAQLAKADKHRLDRPDREKIETMLKKLFWEYGVKVSIPLGLESPDREAYVRPIWADQILALFDKSIEEARRQLRAQAPNLVEEAKEQEREMTLREVGVEREWKSHPEYHPDKIWCAFSYKEYEALKQFPEGVKD